MHIRRHSYLQIHHICTVEESSTMGVSSKEDVSTSDCPRTIYIAELNFNNSSIHRMTCDLSRRNSEWTRKQRQSLR